MGNRSRFQNSSNELMPKSVELVGDPKDSYPPSEINEPGVRGLLKICWGSSSSCIGCGSEEEKSEQILGMGESSSCRGSSFTLYSFSTGSSSSDSSQIISCSSGTSSALKTIVMQLDSLS